MTPAKELDAMLEDGLSLALQEEVEDMGFRSSERASNPFAHQPFRAWLWDLGRRRAAFVAAGAAQREARCSRQ